MSVEQGVGQRNSPFRKLPETVLNPVARLAYAVAPGLEAKHISDAGRGLTEDGIKLQEYVNRNEEFFKAFKVSTTPMILIAAGIVGVGLSFDLFDGIYARFKRSKMTDENKKLADERIGQSYDPEIDGYIEATQSQESKKTAEILGRRWGARAARFTEATSNLARTAKAIRGAITEVSVPETYKITDPRFWGTSLGRKILYLATFFPRFKGLPVQEFLHFGVGVANVWVASERAGIVFDQSVKPELKKLSQKEIDFAQYRAKRLSILSFKNLRRAWLNEPISRLSFEIAS